MTAKTSDLKTFPSKPPISLSMPPTMDAFVFQNARGREARGVHDVAPGVNVKTDERSSVASSPPATTNAWLEMVKLCVRISGFLVLNFRQVILTFGTGQRLNERIFG